MSQPAVSLPLFYQSLVPLDTQKHRGFGLPKKAPNYLYAAKTNLIPLMVTEVSLALRHYPVVFVLEKNASTPTLVALVGNGDGTNQFVDAKGAWKTDAYIPSWVRRYPFFMQLSASDKSVLLFDEKSAVLTSKNTQVLIDKDGNATPLLQSVLTFQNEFLAAAKKTEMVAKALYDAQLLEPASLSVKSGDQQIKKVDGFLVVNEKKLRTLDSATLEKLQNADALGLAYAQLFSMLSLKNIGNSAN